MPCISADGRKRYRCEGEKRKRGYEMALGPLESIISLQHQNTQSMHPLLLASSYRSPPPASLHNPPLQLILPLILHPLYPHQLSLENYKSYELAKSSTTPPSLSPSLFPFHLTTPYLPILNLPHLHPTPSKRPYLNEREKEGDNILSVEPAGIGPMARSPYPNSGGIVSFRLSPMHISRRPSSHLSQRQHLGIYPLHPPIPSPPL
jgi:hypothetical protein